MTYDFDTRIERRGTASEKWEGMEKEFGYPGLLPMWVADMDFASPPCVVEAIRRRAEHPIYGYTMYPDAALAAVQGWLKRRQGWAVEREWLRFTPGVVPGLAFVVRLYTRPGDRIIVQPPVYYPFSMVIERGGRRMVNNPLRRDGGRYVMDLDDLRAKARDGARMLILCSPHNPVGRVWTPDELRAIGDICNEHGVLVVADEIHGDLTYPGIQHTPYASLGEAYARNTIAFTAPSKTFNLAGLQTSVAIIPDERLRARYDGFVEEIFTRFGNTFGMTAMTAAYEGGAEWLDALREYLAGNLAFLEEYVAREIPGIEVVRPEGTYLVWLDCRGLGMGAEELSTFMRAEARVALDDGHIFGSEGAGYERINIACQRSMLAEALERIAAAVRARRAASA